MEKRGILDRVFSNFIFNVILGALLAYGVYALSVSLIVPDYSEVSFLIMTIIIYIFFPLFYSYRNLRWQTISKSKKSSYTFFFAMSMLFIEPFLTSFGIFPLFSGGAGEVEAITKFAFFIAELVAFIPVIIGYTVISNYVKGREL